MPKIEMITFCNLGENKDISSSRSLCGTTII
jgi:hypothetical protein